MKNNFLKSSVVNINSKPSINSEITSQILYGEKFKVLSKNKEWLKIKTNFDNYVGYIKKDKFNQSFKPTHKIYKLKSKIFKMVSNKFLPSSDFLPFASGIEIKSIRRNYIEFEKNKWIKRKDIKIINHKERNFNKIFKLFLNTKYVWGGKTFRGIDCSALLQMFYYYNQSFYPRDTVDQIKYSKKKIIKKKFKKGDIIFWKGHVAICLNSKKLIHAYGPEKKVLIMSISETIKRIEKTAKLVVKKISLIKY